MADPHGIALDPKTGLIYVTNLGTFNERVYNRPNTRRRANKPNWPVGRDNNIPGSGKIQPPAITVFRKDPAVFSVNYFFPSTTIKIPVS
jgi:hypothetical protein